MLRDWVPLFLFLHVMGAIVAFGPSFAFPLIGAASAREPQHAHFGAEISEVITKRIVLPLAVVQGITGVLLIVALGLDLLNTRWLLVAIVLYLIAIGYSYFVQLPTGGRMVELTAMAGGGPPPGAGGPPPGAGGGPPPGAAGGPPPGAGGPPPELLATAKKLQRGGMFLTLLIVLIVLLMVTKPF